MTEKQNKTAKKKTSKKTVKKVSSSKKNLKSDLSKQDLAYFTQLLLEKRKEILGDLTEMENEALRKSRLAASGDLSSMPIHMADLGTDNYEQEFALNLVDSEQKLLERIQEALVRIDNGGYGICEATGKPISRARLEAKPWAKYSIEYARKVENGKAEGNGNHSE